jgi:HD-GYP domain-containing protein (c-di-GMP phosphodiesterase class II)
VPTGNTPGMRPRIGRFGRGAQVPGEELLLDATVDALAGTLGLRDGHTGQHCDRVVTLAHDIGRRLRLPHRDLRDLGYAARLHDIGKVGVPDKVLHKPGPLAEDEWKVIRGHAVWGADLLMRIPGLEGVARIVRHHHERFDGDGYPDGVSGDEIPLGSRILTAADAYVAMTEDRPYRSKRPGFEVNRELREGAGTQFDPLVIDTLRDVVGSGAPA